MKLKTITFKTTPRLPGLRTGTVSEVDCENPHNALYGWRVLVRGPMLYFVSPHGWLPSNSTNPRNRDPKGPRVVHAIPAADAYLQWSIDDNELDGVTKGGMKYDTDELGPKAPPIVIEDEASILARIPAHDIGD